MNESAAKTYHGRFKRVLDFIDEHIDEDLNVEVLSSVASFSKFHFHRQFSALFGVTVLKYVQIARFKRASYRLAFRDDTVLEIALASGYEGPEAFTRAFKKVIGHTPSEVRKRPELAIGQPAYNPAEFTRRKLMTSETGSRQVNIIDFNERRVAVLEHRGDPALIGASIRKFIEWRRRENLPPKVSGTFNILYDNPAEVPPEQFRLDLCAATEKEFAPNGEGIIARVIPSGRCAVLHHVGSEESFIEALGYLYANWLPQSGEELRDFPLFCQRVSFFPDVPEHEAVTDIFLPLK